MPGKGIVRIQILHISANLKQRRSDVDEILKYIKNNDFKIEQKTQRPVFCENWLLSNVVMLGVEHASNKLGTALLSNTNFQLLANEKYDRLVYCANSADLETTAYETRLSVCGDLVKDGIGMMFGYMNYQPYSRLKIIDEWDKIERDIYDICKRQSISCGRDTITNARNLLVKVKSNTNTPLAIMRIIKSYRDMLAHPLNNKKAEEKFADGINALVESPDSAHLERRVKLLRSSVDDDDYAVAFVRSFLPPEIELKNYLASPIGMVESGVPFVLVFIRMLKIWLDGIQK